MLFQKRYWEREKLERRRFPAHEVIREYVVPKIEEIRKVVPITGKTRLLDVGGGNGFFSYYFEKICDTTCIDYSERMIELNPAEKKYVMDAKDLKFRDNSFDVVFCHALLHHVDDMERVIREMRRVSRRYVIVLEPNRNNPLMFMFSLLVKEERGALRFSLDFLRREVESCGLGVVSSFSYGLIVPNKTPRFSLPLLRLFNRKQPFGMTNFIVAKK
jgi:ubiquinone/menaquinone biosynthesis C-methylase UbiE